jgi:hypothetical protein
MMMMMMMMTRVNNYDSNPVLEVNIHSATDEFASLL